MYFRNLLFNVCSFAPQARWKSLIPFEMSSSTQSYIDSPESYLVVGAGVFGASTALHLSRQKPEAKITLLDRLPFPDPIAASHDINKVVVLRQARP